MLRSLTSLTVLSVALFLVGCGGDDAEALPTLDSLFPANNEIGTWAEDTATGTTGTEIARTWPEVNAIINGDAAPFHEVGFAAWGREYYANGTVTLELRIWQMEDTAGAQNVYEGVAALGNALEDARYSGSTWETLGIGDGGRIADTGNSFWVNAHKNLFVVEASTITPNDPAARTAGLALVGAVLDKIP